MSTFWLVSRYLTINAPIETRAAQFLDQTLARDTQDAGRAALVPRREAQHLSNVLGLDLRQRGNLERGAALAEHLGRQVLERHLLSLLEQHHALDQVAELANVPRPGIG